MADTAYQKEYVGSKKTIAGSKAKKKPKKRRKTVAEDFPQESSLTGPGSGSMGGL